jgi:hypothetical protein
MAGSRPGPAPQTAKREQYAALIARGVSFSEACRMVGTIAGRVSVGDTAEQSPVAAAGGRRPHYAPVLRGSGTSRRVPLGGRAGADSGSAPCR